MGGMKEDAPSHFLDLTVRLHAFVASLRRCRKPVVSAVNGVAAGGGFSLALAGDIVVAAESARFALAYQNIGLSPDGGSTFFLARTVGTHRAMELTLTGRTLSAGEAASWGLVQRVFPDASFASETAALAAGIVDGPTLAYGKAKELYNRALLQPLETQMEEERQGIAESARTGDFGRGQALPRKRQPSGENRAASIPFPDAGKFRQLCVHHHLDQSLEGHGRLPAQLRAGAADKDPHRWRRAGDLHPFSHGRPRPKAADRAPG
jgi:enoyl-CoA hydratase/carnithine racemase